MLTIKCYNDTLYLKKWDGTTPESWHVFPIEKSPDPLYEDQYGNILYQNYKGEFCPWCNRGRLAYHLHRLYQIGVIEEVAPA